MATSRRNANPLWKKKEVLDWINTAGNPHQQRLVGGGRKKVLGVLEDLLLEVIVLRRLKKRGSGLQSKRCTSTVKLMTARLGLSKHHHTGAGFSPVPDDWFIWRHDVYGRRFQQEWDKEEKSEEPEDEGERTPSGLKENLSDLIGVRDEFATTFNKRDCLRQAAILRHSRQRIRRQQW
ncbi:hypothetical protein PC118_g18963 [Phytophthora cactorum]|uniref:Uncharacterized protein n=1 Tax=Phytophthora cactorum TaxID=29920 RepID=A0A8T1FBK6_9STRA|nr:hypothetical protein PC118_g18963 [Phytophthora cactorum]